MMRAYQSPLVAFSLALLLSTLAVPAARLKAAAAPVDVLSGTWRVSRTCLTICVSPKPVLKVVHHLSGDVYTTAARPPQMLYLIGRQVLVHGPNDSLLLTIDTPRLLMQGLGVGADGSTFETTWRCIAALASATPVSGASPASRTATRPAHVPMGRGAC